MDLIIENSARDNPVDHNSLVLEMATFLNYAPNRGAQFGIRDRGTTLRGYFR
jgi:hypothetical protein